MAKRSRKVTKKATENKSEAKHINSPTTYNLRNKPILGEVTKITNDGFALRVGGTDYFMAFDNFPWFRYASDTDIEAIDVSYGNPDDSGEFVLAWPMLDIHLGTNHIAWHSLHPIKRPHSVGYPSCSGKLSDRTDEFSEVPRYEVETTFTFKGKFTVVARSAEQAQLFVKNHCRLQCGGAAIDVHNPFYEVIWDFPYRVDPDEFDTVPILALAKDATPPS